MIYITWAHLDCRLSSLVDTPTWTSQVPIPGGQSYHLHFEEGLTYSPTVSLWQNLSVSPGVLFLGPVMVLPFLPEIPRASCSTPGRRRIARASPRSTLLELSLGTFCSLMTEAASPIAAPRPDTKALRQNEQPRPLGACWAGLPVCVPFGPSGVGPYLSKCRGCVAGAP